MGHRRLPLLLAFCLGAASCSPALLPARSVNTLAQGDALELSTARQVNAVARKAWTPEALAYADNGTLWASDSRNHRILNISPTGTVEVLTGAETAGAENGTFQEARFDTPRGLFWDGSILWVADTGNQSIRKIDMATQSVSTAKVPPQLQTPVALAKVQSDLWIAEASGLLWRWNPQRPRTLEKVADLGAHRVIRQLVPGNAGQLYILDNLGVWQLDPDQTPPILTPAISYRENAPRLAGIWPLDRALIFSSPFEAKPLQTLDLEQPTGPLKPLNVDTSALDPGLRYTGLLTGNTQGDLILADVGSQALYQLKADATGTYQASVLAKSGTQGFGERQDKEDLSLPHGVLYLPEKKVVWAADYFHSRILEIDAQGKARPLFENHDPPLSFPTSLIRHRDGSIYISASGSQKIFRYHNEQLKVFAGSGERGLKDGPADKAHFWLPWGMAFDPEDNLYVADHGNHAIRRITPAGEVSTVAGNGRPGLVNGKGAAVRFHHPVDVLFYGNQLLISDSWNHQIRSLNPRTGQVNTYAGREEPGLQEGSRTKARFYCPSGLSEGPDGRLLIADTWNHRIRQMSRQGQISTLAGEGRYYNWNSGTQDGIFGRFHQPRDMSYDAQNQRIYVADTANNSIRVIIP